jgi:hypothetical protein
MAIRLVSIPSANVMFELCFTVGHTLLAINGVPVEGRFLQSDGKDAMEIISSPQNYPINLKFGRTKLTTNERIMLASMFHS